MPESRRGRLLAEGILIVVSVLLAFAIDASWAERGRRQDALRAFRALEQDFEAASALLRQVSNAHRSGVAAGEALLQFTGPQATTIDSDSLAVLIPPLIRMPYLSPSLGAGHVLYSTPARFGWIAENLASGFMAIIVAWPATS